MSKDPPVDRQAGVAIGDFVSDSNRAVAHGDRRGDVHYEPDADQLARVSHHVDADVLPPEQVTREAVEAHALVAGEAAVTSPEPSVWDASPDDGSDPHGR